MSAETITHFGVFIPINQRASTTSPPIPEPVPECLTIVSRGDKWGIFWTLSEEEDMAPEAASSIAWLANSAQAIGRRHILRHGSQYGEPLVMCITRDADERRLSDVTGAERHDWTTSTSLPR